MKDNPNKCYFVTIKSENIQNNVQNKPIIERKHKKLFGVKIDYKLTFNFHIPYFRKLTRHKISKVQRKYPTPY